MAGAALVVLCAPVGALPGLIRAAWPHLAPGAVLTDAGSVKRSVVEAALECPARAGVSFVGGHPMAGSERSGLEASDPDLFEGRLALLTPTTGTPPAAVAAVTALWEGLGSSVRSLSAEAHDRLVAQISHLPHLVAYALVAAVDGEALPLAGRGFTDTTRIAASAEALWADIFRAEPRAASRRARALRGGPAPLARSRGAGRFRGARGGARARARGPGEARVNAVVHPVRRLAGAISVPGDKSVSHRAALLAAVADGATEVQGFLEGEDCLGTLRAVTALGAEVTRKGPGHFVIQGVGLDGLTEPGDVVDCGNSGTTVRLLLGVLAGQPFSTVVTGDDSLRRRPMDRVMEPLARMGARVVGRRDGGRLPLAIRGTRPLQPIRHVSPGGERAGEVGRAPGRTLGLGPGERGRAGAEPGPHGADARGVRRRGPGRRRHGDPVPGPPTHGPPVPRAGRHLVGGVLPGGRGGGSGRGSDRARTSASTRREPARSTSSRPWVREVRIAAREGDGEPVADLTVSVGPTARDRGGRRARAAGDRRAADPGRGGGVRGRPHRGPGRGRASREGVGPDPGARLRARPKLGVDIEERPDGFRVAGAGRVPGRRSAGRECRAGGTTGWRWRSSSPGSLAEGPTVVEGVDCIATSYPDFVPTCRMLAGTDAVEIVP